MRNIPGIVFFVSLLASAVDAGDSRRVFLEATDGARIEVATLFVDEGLYTLDWNAPAFSDHFLSMRPFRCIDGPDKTWCHVPYPYAIRRDIGADLTDLEYDFLFVWKGRGEYGIDMWNGVYYVIEATGDGYVGQMHEMNMDILAVPPEPGEMRPIGRQDLEPADPEGHWLPRLVIE